MKAINHKYTCSRGLPIAAFLATMALANPASATDLGQAFTAVATFPANIMMVEAGSKTPAKQSKVDRVEERIKDLHARLNITPAQESQWNDVTQVMRANAQKMDALTNSRSENAGKMSAVDNLKSYDEIAAAHEEGIKNFIPVFAALYDSMSDGQKRDADVIFRSYGQKASDRTVSKND